MIRSRPGAAAQKASLPRQSRRREGVNCIIFTAYRSIRAAVSQGKSICSSSASTTGIPMASGSRLSVIKVSNTTLVVQRIGPSKPAIHSFMPPSRLDSAWWRSITPLGCPVEPEVYSTYIKSSPPVSQGR